MRHTRHHPVFRILVPVMVLAAACMNQGNPVLAGQGNDHRIPVIIDTDANNELDDQHAIAYLLLNGQTFHTLGVTVNATRSGGCVEAHLREAQRIVKLCGMSGTVPVLKGANGNFEAIRNHVEEMDFDGREAVDFIISKSMQSRDSRLVLLAIGKLTNVALALKKEPPIANRIRVVWLGSNFPEPGEYNLENDTAAMNYVLQTGVPFELVTVRYGKSTGTAAVTVSRDEIDDRMPGKGPRINGKGVTGRHGGTFHCFGDYSVNLFNHIETSDEAGTRALFDMAAVAIVRDPSWASSKEIPCPVFRDGQWLECPGNPGKIILWEDFNREKIMDDFFATFEHQ